jgi:hypothetical protein
MISVENAEKLGIIQNVTGACHSLAQDNYTHHHSQVANIVHQELAIKCGLSKGPPVSHYKYEPQSVLGNFSYKIYHERTHKCLNYP